METVDFEVNEKYSKIFSWFNSNFDSILLISEQAVFFDEKYLKTLEVKMIKKRNESDILKELQKRSESEFKHIQSEYIKVDKAIKLQNANLQST